MKSSRATLVLRIPSSLHQRLKQEARSADLSLNKHCQSLLCKQAPQKSPTSVANPFRLETGCSQRTAVLQDLAEKARKTWGDAIKGIILFGSFARGRQTEKSDIDLLIVLSKNETLDRDLYSPWQTHKVDGREVAPLLVQIPAKEERIGGLWFEVALDGIVLYDRDFELCHFLAQVRDLVVGGKVKRKVTNGHPYWVHCSKPDDHSTRMEAS